jgi:tRNA-splicing ligase RtcB (3'-phosphate/5'-hydroxy nucleic acid ligase)
MEKNILKQNETHINGNCIVYLPENEIDKETGELIQNLSKSNTFKDIRIMPDCHTGSCCCIGMTSKIDDKIIPQIVGGDIGCGISVLQLDKKIREKNYEKIDNVVKSLIPMGESNHKQPIIDDVVMNEIYEKCNEKLVVLKEKYPEHGDLLNDFEFNSEFYKKLTKRAKSCSGGSNYLKSMGTLGGGNHYIEFNEDEENNHYLSVHCGSRHMGQSICMHHQDKIKNKKTYDKKNFLENYLDGIEMVEYLIDMIFAQEFASKNRAVIIELICDTLGYGFNENNIINTTHNYIDFDRFILRKGAISAEQNETCVISLNMRDGILLCEGKGNPEWNYSSAHGCGRLMSRKDARMTFSMKEYKKSMENVYSSCICKETLDEIPEAYKDTEFIKELIGDSVNIIKQLKPIINIKGY